MDKINAVLSRIQGQRVYVDTNIFVYFFEQHERYFDAVVLFFKLFNSGLSLAYTGDAVVAEILYRPYQLNDMVRVSEIKIFFGDAEMITVLPHSTKVFELAAELSPKRGMKLIDALHYATAAIAGCSFILTNDAGFSSGGEIEVIYLNDLCK